ncbi:unnamed protein product [Rotaria magnacalcarata]|uniref:Uncharacterized protein n=1 Tax=Rotaria magnacalcarata TaxID=392030 RepID=A0A816YTA4_9BILA|nr:unnamed protein product [Rotaria magnacalcarata]CAF4057598.1 unnamed protein product [Rotaria magnacalcarata]
MEEAKVFLNSENLDAESKKFHSRNFWVSRQPIGLTRVEKQLLKRTQPTSSKNVPEEEVPPPPPPPPPSSEGGNPIKKIKTEETFIPDIQFPPPISEMETQPPTTTTTEEGEDVVEGRPPTFEDPLHQPELITLEPEEEEEAPIME